MNNASSDPFASFLLYCAVISGDLSNLGKRILDINIRLCASFEVLQVPVPLAPLFRLHARHNPLLRQIGLISDDHKGELLRVLDAGLVHEDLVPFPEILKALQRVRKFYWEVGSRYLGVREAEHQDAAVCSLVEGSSKTMVSLLPSRIPDLGVSSKDEQEVT